MSTQSDLDVLAAKVRYFVDQEIPDVTEWNVDPSVLHDSLHIVIGPAFTNVETGLASTNDRIDQITLPDGTLKPVTEWMGEATPPVYMDTRTFSLLGDHTLSYRQGSRIRATLAAGVTVIGSATSVLYNPGVNQTVIALDSPVLTPALSKVEMSIINQSMPQVRTIDILDKNVTEPKLADGAVSSRTIAAGAVTAAALAPGAVGPAAIGPLSITGAQIANKTIDGTAKLVNNSLDGSQILVNGSVTGAKIAPSTITLGLMAPNSVNGANIVDLSIGPNDIADGSIAGGAPGYRNHIQDLSVWAHTKLANKSYYGRDKIIDGSIDDAQITGLVGTKIQNGTIVAWDKVYPGTINNGLIADKTIWGDSKIANKSIWGANEIADASVANYTIAQNHVTNTPGGSYNGRASFTVGANTTWVAAVQAYVDLFRTQVVLVCVNMSGYWDVTGNPAAKQSWFIIYINGNGWTQRNTWHNTQPGSGTQRMACTWGFSCPLNLGAGRQTFRVDIATQSYNLFIDYADIALLPFGA